MWPFNKKEIEKEECKEVSPENAYWVVAFIDAKAFEGVDHKYSVQPTFKIVGYFSTWEDANKRAHELHGLRFVAPIIRGNEDDPIRGARLHYG